MLSRSLLAAGIVGGLLAAAHPAAAQWPNQFGTYQNSPQVYAPSGTYLGNLNGNQFDPNSVANPYGPHGSPFAPNSRTPMAAPTGTGVSGDARAENPASAGFLLPETLRYLWRIAICKGQQ